MPLDITLRQLRAFIAVLDSGSFSEAAQTMHLSQAALSGLIKELEGRLGVRLLDRNTRSVGVSVVGSAFEPMARRVLAATEDAVQSVTNLKDLRRGLIRVAAPEPLSCTLLPELIAGYVERYPGVDVRFDDVPIEQVLSNLHSGSSDLGFGPAGVLADDAVEAHMIRVDPLWAALRRDDPLAASDSVSWQDLRERALINYMPNLALNVLSHVPQRHHPGNVVPVHRVNTALALLKFRPGYVICPSMSRSLVEGFGLAFLPLRQPAVTWRIAIFARQRDALSPAVESFLDYALDMAATWDGSRPTPKTKQHHNK
ncbi:LysR family transcriptional regulator [Bordetella sp. FB-8]|uniref:LysR family transcriptional regulator n=1 Tax=Bordetella sp. FB-8 TaxID=1159870 RepID=UPI000380AF86|nr:LysR family transcriptional regulator [Bordetella sp. FB-8]